MDSRQRLGFLHTSPVHVATFGHLAVEVCPEIPLAHVVGEELLRDARSEGITPALEQRIGEILDGMVREGAAAVACTCSTIGGCAEEAARRRGIALVRVDRAMAQQAVALGERIALVAALASTIGPTRQLILGEAAGVGKTVTVVEVLCDGAWPAFEHGDLANYHARVAQAALMAALQSDVVVLAQASMAGALPLCEEATVPILSSPRLGLAAAADAYRRALCPTTDMEVIRMKEELLNGLQDEYRHWLALLSAIEPERMDQPGVAGNWSIKDIVAHLTGWRRRTVGRLQAMARGEPEPPPPWPPELQTDDEINAWIYRTSVDQSVREVLDDSDAVFRQMMAALAAIPEAVLANASRLPWMEGQPFTAAAFFGHFHEEHEADMRAWLAQQGPA